MSLPHFLDLNTIAMSVNDVDVNAQDLERAITRIYIFYYDKTSS